MSEINWREQKAILAGRDEASIRAGWEKLDERAKELEKELEGMREYATYRKGLARWEQELEKKRQNRDELSQGLSEKRGEFNAILKGQDVSNLNELEEKLRQQWANCLDKSPVADTAKCAISRKKQCFSLAHPEKGDVLEEREMNPGVRDPLYFAARIALAKRLTGGKPFILLGEPFANLDGERVRGVIRVCQWLETEHGMQL